MADAPRLRNGHTRVHTLDGSCYVLPMAERDSIRNAWRAGAAFWDGFNFYGGELSIKLARVEGVSLMTADALAASAADEKAEEAEAQADTKPWERDG